MCARSLLAAGVLLFALSACGEDAASCDNDSMTLTVDAGTPATYLEGSTRCGAETDPYLVGEVLPEDPYTRVQLLSIRLNSDWDAAQHQPGTNYGYRTGMTLWIPGGWTTGVPLPLALGRFYAQPAYGCYNGKPPDAGSVTLTAFDPAGGRIAGSFADVALPAAEFACPPTVTPGTGSVLLNGTFDVTRVR